MRKMIYIVAALLLASGLAYAGQNIQQRDHGGAVWVQSSDGTINPAGDTGIVTAITDVTTAWTKYLLAPKTGNITRLYTVLQGAMTGSDAVFSLHTNHSGGFIATGHEVTITQSGSAAGDVDSSILDPSSTTKVDQGDVIGIAIAGGSVATGVQFTIFIE